MAQGSADQGYAQIASPVFLPPAPKIFRPNPGPSTSTWPTFNNALKVARALEVRPSIETFKRIEEVERTVDPRPRKKRSLQERIEPKEDVEVVSLHEDSDDDVEMAIATAAGLPGTSS